MSRIKEDTDALEKIVGVSNNTTPKTPQERAEENRKKQQKKRDFNQAVQKAKNGNPSDLGKMVNDAISEKNVWIIRGKQVLGEHTETVNKVFVNREQKDLWLVENWDTLIDISEIETNTTEINKLKKASTIRNIKESLHWTSDKNINTLIERSLRLSSTTPFDVQKKNGNLTENTTAYNFSHRLIEQYGNPKKWSIAGSTFKSIKDNKGNIIAENMVDGMAETFKNYAITVYESLGY